MDRLKAHFQAQRASGTAFEEIIDGYFPLAVSLAQMMTRRSISQAYVMLTHAPIMQIPGLAPEAPVPLSIRQGRAGIIDEMFLHVHSHDGTCQLSGEGRWRWLDGTPTGTTFDPLTRLAEPAFLRGVIPATPVQKATAPRIERTEDEHF